ncbi:MAG: N-acetylmuramoyl-L-alanine amidase [Acidobacteriota bacterium]
MPHIETHATVSKRTAELYRICIVQLTGYYEGTLSPRFCLAAVCTLLAIVGGMTAAQAPTAAPPYTVLTRDGRRPLATRLASGQDMFALDDLAPLFDLTIKEDAAAGGLTITVRNQIIVLSAGQSLASVGGRLISLPSPPVHDGRTWLVPVDFVSRALAPLAGLRVELRKPSRLLLIGDIRAPRVAGRIEPLGSLARLTLEVLPATPHTVSQDGPRLVIRFEADTLDAVLPPTTAPELIQGVRPGDGPATVVVDLGPRFASFRTSDVPGDRGALRIVIDVVSASAEAPAAPQALPPPSVAAPDGPPLIDLAPAGGLRTVVIDAGHGGSEDGAKGAGGTLEKNVTLIVARRLKAALEARLGVRVILTRDGDTTVGLDERAALANNNKADLFVSLHANGSMRAAANGAQIFYLSLEEYGDAAQRAAHAESESLPAFGGGARDIELTPWEMAQARYIDESAALAQAIESSLRERVPMSRRAIQQAPLRVLVGANMPAVLLEMGFLTNPDQEKQLRSDEFQNTLVQALVTGITRFRDARGASRPAAAPAPAGTVR